MRTEPAKVAFVCPRFSPDSFWNYQATCAVVGKRYSAAPLGPITVAALLPADWQVRLVDRNVEELEDGTLDWADLVMISAMMPQQGDAKAIMARAHTRGRPVVIGGPDVSCSPHIYEEADFQVLGEAEEVIGELVAAWRRGDTRGVFRASGYPDITRSPVPRFDLLRIDRYLHVGVQYSRGCPYGCEFCNVIEINGRRPRVKTTEQMLTELEALYRLGYRGHVDFVDDNLIGNRVALKGLLRALGPWLLARRHPFEFTTEASVNLADDEELLGLMQETGFFAVFLGVETPDQEALKAAHKPQNTRRDMVTGIQRIYRAGIFVNAGFIIGFDTERGSVAAAMTDFIERTAIPVAMVGLLYALPNTQLARRLQAEGRLHPDHDRQLPNQVDQCMSGLNFDLKRPRREALADYQEIVESIYAPAAYFGRVRRAVRALDRSKARFRPSVVQTLRDLRALLRIGWRLGVLDRRARGSWWRAFFDTLLCNPRAAKITASFGALYLHFGPLSERISTHVAERIATEGDRMTERQRSAASGLRRADG
ncbi:MAG TPA: B12-binding domain-containing radical SAM protein [Vicinamibacteria bacterium]|nr:B12-binding domain-containing radical SAM protein [Vicinamibacteria bacterium]